VIFDVGGVVITSPLIAIAAYERERGFPKDWLNVLITGYGHNGSWQKFERGELDLFPFYEGFGRELSNVEKGKQWYSQYCSKRNLEFPQLPSPSEMQVDGRELFGRMMRGSQFDKIVVHAIKEIRASKRFHVIAVTNNFGTPAQGIPQSEIEFLGWTSGAASTSQQLRELFDDYIDSSEVGMRKPESAIYKLACERNGLNATEVVMLDDLGMNLKPAKDMGMTTIHVQIGRSEEAIQQLSHILGLELFEGRTVHPSKL
ncbi:hypothetical protein FRC17_006595, partial [Serendipita sp. 399]